MIGSGNNPLEGREFKDGMGLVAKTEGKGVVAVFEPGDMTRYKITRFANIATIRVGGIFVGIDAAEYGYDFERAIDCSKRELGLSDYTAAMFVRLLKEMEPDE